MSSEFKPVVTAFCCRYAVYNFADDLSGLTEAGFPENVRIEQVPCSGRVDVVRLLKALEQGADGIYIVGCQEERCHNRSGSQRAKKRTEYVRDVLVQLGLEPERVEIFLIPRDDETQFIERAKEIVRKIRALGPSPLRGE